MGREQRDRDDKLRERSTDPKDQTEIRSMKIRPIGRPRAVERSADSKASTSRSLRDYQRSFSSRYAASSIQVQHYFTRHLRFNFYKEAFTGGDAVREMSISGSAEDRRSMEMSLRSIALATEEALNVLAKVLHKVFERKNKLLFYKGFIACIVDAEAVNVIRIAITHIDAVLIGQVLLDEGLIEPIATAVFTCTVFSTEQLAEV
ncbi:hypothetical protein GN958_ATG01395 [Phytophthora infestans]|uniref:Uncharacterized protein n=1 Tax=Phytophthora infestans TaxID=4787 RepID=A0A8S9V9X0_PHYIN|nr:hypothetical protein GN958_ATG01395 [Phytophthora infestans]